MKRDRAPDSDDDNDDDDNRDSKRSRVNEKKRIFTDRQGSKDFREEHHPEKCAKTLLAAREHALAALTSFASDLKAGALTGPRLAKPGLLRELPQATADDESPPELPSSAAPSHMANLEPLPSTAMALARAVLCSAGAGPASAAATAAAASSAGEPSADGAEEKKEPPPAAGLLSLLFAEPINHKTRIWAAYASRSAAEGGARAFRSLPQISELTDPPQSLKDHLMPTKELKPQSLSDEEITKHTELCDKMIGAIESRLGLAIGPSERPYSTEFLSGLPSHPQLTPSELLELRILYLRRVHYFEYNGGGGAFQTHTKLLAARGEAHFPMGVLIHASRDPLAAPIRYDTAEQCVDAHLAYLSALTALDEKFEKAAEEAVEKFYEANCVEEEPRKFRCPLSGKLFKDTVFVRKHIDNKHGHKLIEAKRAAYEAKYEEYYMASVERNASMPPVPPQPPRFPHEGKGGRGKGKGGDGYGKGGRGGGKGDFGKGMGGGMGYGPPGMGGRGGGRAPPPPEGAMVINRPMVTYRDLDAPDDDDLFS